MQTAVHFLQYDTCIFKDMNPEYVDNRGILKCIQYVSGVFSTLSMINRSIY